MITRTVKTLEREGQLSVSVEDDRGNILFMLVAPVRSILWDSPDYNKAIAFMVSTNKLPTDVL